MPSSSNIRAGAAYIELYTKDSRLVKGLNRAAARLKAFGDGITSVGKKFAALGTAIITPLVGAANVFADMGSDLVDMSQRTGVSVEALSELSFAAAQSGTDVETLEGSLKKMQKFLVTAAQGSKEANDALAQLGLSVADLSRLAPEDQFSLIADRLSQIRNPALRTAVAMQIFGKSGTALLPLMQDGAKGIEALRQQARDLGLTMSTEDAKAAETFGDTLDALWKVLKRTVFSIGSALAPLLTQVAEMIMRAAKTTSEWISQNKGLVVTVFKVAAAVLAGGAALVILGTAIKGIGIVLGGIGTLITTAGAALGALVTILGSLLSPIGLVIAGLGALAAYIIYATGAGGKALSWLSDQFGALKDDALPVYNFSETHYLADSAVTSAYKATLFFLTGRVNNAAFKGFAAGEVLFLGASGSKRGTEDWEITYRFAASPNVTGLSVGPITGINKKGWEYLWVRYADAEDQHVLVKQPIAAYVEQVYQLGNFSALGIGV